jgi:hypothetical protein
MHDQKRTMTGDEMKDQLQPQIEQAKSANIRKGISQFNQVQSGPEQQKHTASSPDVDGGHMA